MPKGAVIEFDELNQKQWHYETLVLMDTIRIGLVEINRIDFNSQLSYGIEA
jgi:hypothetical protein